MSSCYELHAAFRYGTSSGGLQFSAYFVNNNNLRHMVLYRFNHYRMLFRSASHLHAARSTNTGVRNIAISSNFVGGVHNDYTFIGFVCQNTCYFTQQCGFAHTWATKNQDRLTLFDNISNQRNTAEYRSTNAAGQTNNFSFSISKSADTMESALDTSTVVVTKFTYSLDHILEVSIGHWLST